MYIVINSHDVDRIDLAYIDAFWGYVAPRYKDRTHVIYELQNEPTFSVLNTPEAVFELNEQVYQTIRNAAPQTHVMLMSYACLPAANPGADVAGDVERLREFCDFSNESIAFHGYWWCEGGGMEENIQAAKRLNVPLVNTEFEDITDNVRYMEQQQIGWFAWQTCDKQRFQSNWVNGLLPHARSNGYLWTFDKDLYTSATAVVSEPARTGPRLRVEETHRAVYGIDGRRVPAVNKSVPGVKICCTLPGAQWTVGSGQVQN